MKSLILNESMRGVNLQVLYQGLRQLPVSSMLAAVLAQPSSRYVRILGFLWESFNQKQLTDALSIAGPTVMVFIQNAISPERINATPVGG